MSSYEMRAIRFIQQIFPYIDNCHTVEQYDNAVDRFNSVYNRSVICNSGSARVALITSDYVIKIDYNPQNVRRWGGCAEEWRFYSRAYQEGFAYLLAKIKPYYYRGQVFYIMPRVNGVGSRWHDADEYLTQRERDWCDEVGLKDLHMENYGWKNGHVVIIDYAANDYRTHRPTFW